MKTADPRRSTPKPRQRRKPEFMKLHDVRTYKSAEPLAREDQLAWKLAAVATDPVVVEAEVAEMIGNRIIDNAAVAAASIARKPKRSARAQALGHSSERGAALFRLDDTGRVGRTTDEQQ